MNIIQKQPNPSGAYPALQTWQDGQPPEGYAIIPDDFDMTDFYEHNGFVVFTIVNNTVAEYEPNIDAWEEWKASLPEPTPQADPPSTVDMAEMLLDLETRTSLLEMGVNK